MTTYHVLNGDCLAKQLIATTINQNFIICRECLMDGNLKVTNDSEFWQLRANYIEKTYQVSGADYKSNTVNEFEKLLHLQDHSEVCLWFENDLFCQVNMWFVISLLANNPTLKIYRVFPIVENIADTWKGFSIADAEKLEQAYSKKFQFYVNDIDLGKNLWSAFKKEDFETLKSLSKIKSNCFDFLEEVCQAHIDRFPEGNGRPDKLMNDILGTHPMEFQEAYQKFSVFAGIYGFTDLQARDIYNRQVKSI